MRGGIDVSQYITVFPDNATDKSVTYEISSSDSEYATVSSSGIVKAKAINGPFKQQGKILGMIMETLLQPLNLLG